MIPDLLIQDGQDVPRIIMKKGQFRQSQDRKCPSFFNYFITGNFESDSLIDESGYSKSESLPAR
jgi:hypothetical protein